MINANKKKGEHMEFKEEVSLDDFNKNNQPLDIAQNESEHPYQKMHEIIKKKIRLTKLIVYTISFCVGFAIFIRILSFGELFSVWKKNNFFFIFFRLVIVKII